MKTEENSFESEFAVVRQLQASDNRSRCVDAFALAVLKAERQARRIFTFLAYQADCFNTPEVPLLRKVLADHDKFDFSSALTGIDMLSPTHLSEMIGPNYDALISSLARTKTIRNKLFHGQVTSEGLTREALTKSIADVVSWSSALSAFAYSQFGYDGFNLSSSYTKHADEGFSSTLKLQLTSVENFEHLIKDAHRKGKALLHQSS